MKKIKEKKLKKNNGTAGVFWRITYGYRRFFLYTFLITVVGVLFDFLRPQILRFTVDSVLDDKPFDLPEFAVKWLESLGGREFLRQNLYICAVVFLICALISGLAYLACRFSVVNSSEGVIRNLRDKLYSHIQRLPYAWHTQHQTGDIIQRCTSDVDMIRGFFASQLTEVFRTVILVTIALTMMFAVNVKISLIALAFIPFVILYSMIFYKKISAKFKYADEAEGELSAVAQENFTGVRVVRAFGREAYEINKFNEKNNKFANLWIKLGYMLSIYWGTGDLVTGLQVLVISILGIIEAVNGNLTLGGFILFVSYNSMMVWPVRNFGRILSEMSKTGVSIKRINEILDTEEEKDDEGSFESDMHGDIVFDNVSFDYYGINPVINGVSFTIPAGSTVGILGGTGSGKTTLIQLLDRLYDLPENSGKITIGGIDIRKIKREHLRRNIGYVMQEPFLFSKTIRDNIGISSIGSKLENIRNSAEIAAVDDAVMQFSDGYDTIIGERGVTLSGGQKQRIAIARMLMQNTPIMVFDDSLSAVDSETDTKIRSALKKNLKNSTVIIISHRITTISHADYIIVMDNGKVSQLGTHEELIKSDGIYSQIYSMQGTLENELRAIAKEEVCINEL